MTVVVEIETCNYHFIGDLEFQNIRIQFEKKFPNGSSKIVTYASLFSNNFILNSNWRLVENDFIDELIYFKEHFKTNFNYEGFFYLCLRKRVGYLDSFEELNDKWILEHLSNKIYRENPGEEFIYQEMFEENRKMSLFQG